MLPREHFEASLEPVRLKCLVPFLVVVGIVGVEPVAFPIDVQVRDLSEFWRLDQELLLGNQVRDELDFGMVQMKLPAVEIAIHVGIREKNLRRAAFDDDVQDVRALQFIERLRRQDHRGVVLAPGLESLDHVALDAGVFQENPGFIDEEGFEGGAYLAVANDGIGAVQKVEQERLKKLRIPAHALEIEGLEAGERNGVLGVVEQESELSAPGPFREPGRQVVAERVGQYAECAQRGIDGVEIFDLVIEIALGRRIKFASLLGQNQNLDK